MSTNKLTILISSPESYRDVFNISSDLFQKNWPDCPYYKMYATDYIDLNLCTKTNEKFYYKGCELFLFPDAKVAIPRIKTALTFITSKYTMLISDDMFFVKKVDSIQFRNLINFMESKDMVFCKLNKDKSIALSKNLISANIHQIMYDQPYGRNLQVAIWNTNFLKTFLSSVGPNPYEIEENWLKEGLTKKNVKIEGHCYFHNDYLYHSVYKGKWLRNAKRIVKKQKINFVSERPKISIKTTFLNKLKKMMRNLVSAEKRVKIKKRLAKYFDIDTKY